MPSNDKAFVAEVEAFGTKVLPVRFLEFQKMLAREVFSRVVPRTRVDTGRARGGWQIGIGSVPTTETGVLDKSGGQTINAGLAKLAELKPNQNIIIANPVPYVIFLEGMDGMLALSIQEVDLMFKLVP